MLKPLTPSTQTDLSNGVAAAMAAIDHGAGITEALAKQAVDRRWSPHHCRLAAIAYNVSSQESQRRTAATTAEKFASFPLADPAAVVLAVWPEPAAEDDTPPAKKAFDAGLPPMPADFYAGVDAVCQHQRAASAAQVRQAMPVKAAAAPEPAPETLADSRRRLWKLKQAADALGTEYEMGRRKLAVCLERLEAYVRTHDPAGDHAGQLEKTAALQQAGEHVTAVFDALAARFRRPLKRAGQVRDYTELPPDAPVATVKTASDLISLSAKLEASHAKVRDEIATVEPLLYADRRRPGDTLVPGGVKRAGATAALAPGGVKQAGSKATLIAATLGRWSAGSGGEGKSPNPLVSADHEVAMQGVQAQSAVAEMLATDDVIGSYTPEEVTRAYNDVVASAPNIADKPLQLRAVISRHLAATMQPFEAKEVGGLNADALKSDEFRASAAGGDLRLQSFEAAM